MSGVFRNLVSRDRDKKEFFFYDKFVPFFPACDIDYIEFITPTPTPTPLPCEIEIVANGYDGTYRFIDFKQIDGTFANYTINCNSLYSAFQNNTNLNQYLIYSSINGTYQLRTISENSLTCGLNFNTLITDFPTFIDVETINGYYIPEQDTYGFGEYEVILTTNSECSNRNLMTLTPTPTQTQTPTVTPTPTLTPNLSPSNTPTQTQTPTVTPTPTKTPNVTPSNTPTNTVTPSITPSITPTMTLSSTPLSPYFIFDINTSLTSTNSTNNRQFRLPQIITTNGTATINWGDGNTENLTGGTSTTVIPSIIHTYATSGIYTITLYCTGSTVFKSFRPAAWERKIIEIKNWGDQLDLALGSTLTPKGGAEFLKDQPITNISALDQLNTNGWASMTQAFYDTDFNEDLSYFNMSACTRTDLMFQGNTLFDNGGNDDIGLWDMSNVINSENMFAVCSNFNRNINNWNVSNVTNMSDMFYYASTFNRSLNSWNVSNVTTMRAMFRRASSFNGNISSWNVSNVTDMYDMFYSATTFNQNISNWDTSNVTTFQNMFRYATSFNQNLGNWNISSLTHAGNMLDNTSLSPTNYSNLLIGWAAQAPNINTGVILGASNLNYFSLAASARNTLVNTYGWTIIDAGQI